LWRRGAAPLDLGLNRGVSSFLRINDAGQVMGTTFDRNGNPQAFSWTRTGGVLRLRGRGIASSDARALNEAGQITGSFTPTGGEFTGFLWTPGRSFIELQGNRPIPFGLNDRGMVVGVIFLTQTAFVWTRERGTENIGVLPGGGFSTAYGVNNREEVVGQSSTADSQHAFLWTREEGMIDLNSRLRNAPPGFAVTIATQINEHGAILGSTIDGSLVALLPGNGTSEAPVVSSINGPIIARFGEPQSFSAAFTDVDVHDTHTAIWSWGDGTQDAGTVTERRGAGTVTGTAHFRGA
jgi:probable HAF family extracellular repeat protein